MASTAVRVNRPIANALRTVAGSERLVTFSTGYGHVRSVERKSGPCVIEQGWLEDIVVVARDAIVVELTHVGIGVTVGTLAVGKVTPAPQRLAVIRALQAVTIKTGNSYVFALQLKPCAAMVEAVQLPAIYLVTGCTVLLKLTCMRICVAVTAGGEIQPTKQRGCARWGLCRRAMTGAALDGAMLAAQRKSSLLVIDRGLLETLDIVT